MTIKVNVQKLPAPILPRPKVRKEKVPAWYIESLKERHREDRIKKERPKGQTPAYVQKQAILVSLYQEGMTARQISDEMGLSIETVRRRLREARRDGQIEDAPQLPSVWTQEEEDIVAEMYNAGVSCVEIAEKIGKTKDAVSGRVGRLRKEGRIHAYHRNFKTER